jgi:hypothetical protein
VDSYRPVEFQVFVLRFWREGTSGTWRGQIVHLPDQETAAFADWSQAVAFVGRFVMGPNSGAQGADPGVASPAEPRGEP